MREAGPAVGAQVQARVGHRGAGDVAAQPLQARAVLGGDGAADVQAVAVHTAGVRGDLELLTDLDPAAFPPDFQADRLALWTRQAGQRLLDGPCRLCAVGCPVNRLQRSGGRQHGPLQRPSLDVSALVPVGCEVARDPENPGLGPVERGDFGPVAIQLQADLLE